LALFTISYLLIPDEDRGKTTLQWGNPHRLDHHILGMVSVQASLYKLPAKPEFEQIWLWDDPSFDPMDPQPSERLLVKEIYEIYKREMDRVQSDKQIRFPEHYVIGSELQRKLGFFHQRAMRYHSSTPELLFQVFLGAKVIDLGTVMTGKTSDLKTLKPIYLKKILNDYQLSSLHQEEEIKQLYDKQQYDKISEYAIDDVQTILQLYHQIKDAT